jgi:diguanylate cyclase (GGDEF)-like protein
VANLFDDTRGYLAFSEQEVAAILQAGRSCVYRAGETILDKDAVGDSMYILIEGEVEVELGFQESFRLGERGDYFGELSFLDPAHKRSATVRATSGSRLCSLDQSAIDQLSDTHPRTLMTLIRRTCAFLIEAEEQLIDSLTRKNQELEQSYDFLRRTRQELNYQELLAQTDELTGLYNRRCFGAQLAKAVKWIGANGRPVGVVLIDLDDFKPINDRLGHSAGDEVLGQVAEIIKQDVGANHLPCRLGGDEFAVLLTNMRPDEVEQRAEAIRAGVQAMAPVQQTELRVTASLGIAVYRDGDSVETLLKRADRNLYLSKELGRNRVVWDDGPESPLPARG